jgi:hypothetical protein
MADPDRTASLMTPSKLAQVKPKAPASPAAWLDQMAADAGHHHVRRLAELRKEFEAQAQRSDFPPFLAELAHLGEALPRLDFDLLQPRGWWARMTGKDRSAGTEFAGQFEQIDKIALEFSVQAQALHTKQQKHACRSDLALVEFEVEFSAIDKIMEQGTRWLHDMRNQLKVRGAAATDESSQQQIRDDGARCEILVERLKALRGVSSAAQHSHQQVQAASVRRAALLQLLQQALASAVKDWRSRLSTLASAAGEGNPPALSLGGAKEAHAGLQRSVKQVTADYGQLQVQEKSLADSFSALGAQLATVL